ncbi:flagellar biosynthesis anti-sigma factor FlgM [Propionivibrio limicola]|uniref:flagellar biosynthesis anti-sigma factor FlgM n=1 Tax=Propionivibrio limicola TaxID=167645 RepID=UPI0012919E9D|nr:flagellar biosynthesis anti-sigma factor FlgM [Propionivibrio limicola]
MKIDNLAKTSGTTLVKETRNQAATKASPSASDEVQLSSLSTQLRATDDEPAFDAARVSEIKAAITEGRFSINAGAIADRLIADAKELVDSQRKA